MRNEKLTAYSLHHKTYRDKRSLYYLFTRESGILHGIGKRGIPQFVPLTLFASGKKSLKTLQQIAASHMVAPLDGEQQYAALYLNEVILKLLPIEDPVPILFDKYVLAITNLRQPLSSNELRLVLRLFEEALFQQIGYGLDFYQDIKGQPIDSNKLYQYIVTEGWQSVETDSDERQEDIVLGSIIIAMQLGINRQNLKVFSWLHRQLINHLFDYKPLQSRLLWQQFNKYR